jgi:hypothetical protein
MTLRLASQAQGGRQAPARAATLLAILEAEGPSLRFLRAFADEPRPVRRLVVHWLALGWPGGGKR